MASTLIPMNATPTGMRLNEWVAMEEGLFAKEGLDVKVDWEVLHRQQARQGTMADKDMPRAEDLRLGKFLPKSEFTSACGWGSICMAGAGMGKFLSTSHGMSPCGIFVRSGSKITRPEQLKDVPIGVGLRAGSHFSLYYVLEKYLPLENINAVNVGGFGARLEALLKGTVEAANLLPPQIYMAKQLGLREVLSGEFPVIWWVNDSTDSDKVARYLRAIAAAEKLLQKDLKKYLPLWKYSIPREFEDQTWDYANFGRGERYVDAPVSKDDFETMVQANERWKLDNHVTNRSFESLAFQIA
jgi:ABC-type nitrate/sulfonate/bicarbonate transport system substrate-binding protein